MINPAMLLWWKKFLNAKLSARLAADFSANRPFGDRQRDEALARFPVDESAEWSAGQLIVLCEFAEWYAMQMLEDYKKTQKKGEE